MKYISAVMHARCYKPKEEIDGEFDNRHDWIWSFSIAPSMLRTHGILIPPMIFVYSYLKYNSPDESNIGCGFYHLYFQLR